FQAEDGIRDFHVTGVQTCALPISPVHLLGAGEAGESPLVAHMEDLTFSGAFRRSSRAAFAEAGITAADVDHLMIYDPFAHVPLRSEERRVGTECRAPRAAQRAAQR